MFIIIDSYIHFFSSIDRNIEVKLQSNKLDTIEIQLYELETMSKSGNWNTKVYHTWVIELLKILLFLVPKKTIRRQHLFGRRATISICRARLDSTWLC